MSSNRSSSAIPQTPAHWQHVQIVETPPIIGTSAFPYYKLTAGIFDSLIGWQTCKAAGIEKGNGLSLSEALTAGAKLEAWLAKQEVKTK